MSTPSPNLNFSLTNPSIIPSYHSSIPGNRSLILTTLILSGATFIASSIWGLIVYTVPYELVHESSEDNDRDSLLYGTPPAERHLAVLRRWENQCKREESVGTPPRVVGAAGGLFGHYQYVRIRLMGRRRGVATRRTTGGMK
ncbi:hypothetical protein BDD12DRAFT_807847 [Trichophaea hybrida]|nr:hypothetical protein BDD12DRAFT_807847 [Trichophaea hybrida]